MIVKELREQLDKIEDENTVIVFQSKKILEEVDFVEFIHGEYKSFPTGEIKIDDVVLIY